MAPLAEEAAPLTVPVGQAPEFTGTPTSPTAYSPLGGRPAGPARSTGAPSGPSGNTPTNIALTDAELKSLLSSSESTPSSVETTDELPGVPTRVAIMPQGDHTKVARYEMPTTATVPLSVLKRPHSLDNPFDSAYPNTLSHATGQEMSLRPRLLPQWSTVREVTLRLVGVVPRSRVRLAVTGGVLTLVLALIVIWLASSGDPPGDKNLGVSATPAGGPGSDAVPPGLLADGGTGARVGKDGKPAAGVAGEPEDKDKDKDKDRDKDKDKDKGGKAGAGKSGKASATKKAAGKAGPETKKRP